MSRTNAKFRTVFLRNQNNGVDFSGFSEQLIIRVGKGCNFRCVFCNVADNENVLSLKSSIKEILALTFYKLKYSNIKSGDINVTISGGEPSIFQKETLFIIKYFKKYFLDHGINPLFDIQSNGSNIDSHFATQLAGLGIGEALISSHAHNPEIYKQIIGCSYEEMGPRFAIGVRNLLNAGVRVSFNSILNKVNNPHYFEHIKYLIETYPEVELYNIGYIQPHGMAQKNFGLLVDEYSNVSYTYNKVIGFLKMKGKRVHSHLVGLPLCYLDEWGSSMEYMHNKNIVHSPERHTLIQEINDSNKTHVPACSSCMAKRYCSGVWKEYALIQKLKPIKYKIYTPNDSFLSIKQIKKEYDAGKRQFFLDGDIPKEDLYTLIHAIKKCGFAWISIVTQLDREIEEFSHFASCNIQLFSDLATIECSAKKIREYNMNAIFQRQIQFDGVVNNNAVSQEISQSICDQNISIWHDGNKISGK